MKLHFFYFFILFISLSINAQDSLKTYTIKNQFDEMYRTSTSYQAYKVINKERFQKLKRDVIDSIKSSKKKILQKENLLKTELTKNQNSKTELTKTQQDLALVTKKVDSISFFGADINKVTYNLILWFLIIALLLALLLFITKFSKSNIITKKAQNTLLETEQEFELHRKKALEREQKLRRQLQDEINKQKN